MQNYLDIVLKKELEADEFLSLDPMTGVYPSNTLVNVVPAARNANVTNATSPNLFPNAASVNYREPAYFNVSTLNGALSYTVQFPLRLIKNTAFSIDKSLYFAQTTYLKVYFSPLSKFCYASTQNSNPSAGTKSAYQPAAGNAVIGPMTGAANNISFQLMLAVETNQDLRTMIINKVTSPGLLYLIPYVQAFKTSNQGESPYNSIKVTVVL